MSDDLCGVDPARLAKAAAMLEQLRDALAENAPRIVSTMNEYGGSPISLGLLTEAQSRSIIDAIDMRARSNLAQKLLLHDERLGRHPSTVRIAWDGAAVDAASAKADAQLLSEAEHDPHSAQAVADIQAVADDIQGHIDQGDTTYLSDFYNQAGPQIADLAATLHDLNGSASQPMTLALQHVFTSQDEAATAAPRGDSLADEQSARAAYNIISQTPAPLIEGGTVVWQVSAPVRQALMETFVRYLPDIAFSADDAVLPAPPVSQPSGPGTPWAIAVKSPQVSAFLQELSLDKKDFTAMEAMSGLAMGTSIGLVAEGKAKVIPGMSVDPVRDFATLYARIGIEAAKVGITEAQQKDLRDQQLNQMISLAEAGIGVIPGGGDVLVSAKALAAVSAPSLPQFSTDNAARAIAAAQERQANQGLLAVLPLVRGLAATKGALPIPPPADSFNAHGQPTQALGNWWRAHSDEMVAGKSVSDWLNQIRLVMGLQSSTSL